uniref:Uncharacterized protein n=1 Tax=Chromera velia CCMP2878 TaxID=1169474 RepID=A0A0G4HE03_9ALVE|eukprot:Cvel_964.t1-p1 / transcript=Cvel_964.t1 / gene=Cvel_964 / organism=Chromera_velia_CCMP2878 / gene_product=hypothetical protein / transcript_product=hypothetical protein / location=Cvel_scaffold31:51149-52752(+) / protein_length=258 / sequence_SO=supercontig / SO=protein_coding / is_pseudo=false
MTGCLIEERAGLLLLNPVAMKLEKGEVREGFEAWDFEGVEVGREVEAGGEEVEEEEVGEVEGGDQSQTAHANEKKEEKKGGKGTCFEKGREVTKRMNGGSPSLASSRPPTLFFHTFSFPRQDRETPEENKTNMEEEEVGEVEEEDQSQMAHASEKKEEKKGGKGTCFEKGGEVTKKMNGSSPGLAFSRPPTLFSHTLSFLCQDRETSEESKMMGAQERGRAKGSKTVGRQRHEEEEEMGEEEEESESRVKGKGRRGAT